jgi:hypothetical protein
MSEPLPRAQIDVDTRSMKIPRPFHMSTRISVLPDPERRRRLIITNNAASRLNTGIIVWSDQLAPPANQIRFANGRKAER